MAYDPKCADLADHFLGAAPDTLKAGLAQHVQDSVETWLSASAAAREDAVRPYRDVRLLTRDGGYVTTVAVLSLTPSVEIVNWGERWFVHQPDGTYREGLVCVTQEPPRRESAA